MGMSQGMRLKSLIEDLLLVAAADHHDIKVARDPVPLPALLTSLEEEYIRLSVSGCR